jgi:hypothetical protein
VVGNDAEVIKREAMDALDRAPGSGRVPELWDGKAASRIVDAILDA